MAALVGKQLGGYQILEEIGRGGMAVVYKAYQAAQRRYVALKVLPPYFQHDRQLMARFLREGEAATAFEHPNIVRVYEAGQAEGLYYLAMQYVDGHSLAQELARCRGALDPVAAVDIASQIGSALTYAHRQGVIHRDVKPSNILLSRDGPALLSDFGIAKAFGKTTITQPGALLGTPAYMSPEQGRGRRDLDGRTDIYSLGIVLYEMLTGDVPFRGDDPTVILRAVLDEQPIPPSRLNPTVSTALERVALRALAKERRQRYQTMGEMLAGLEAARYAQRGGPPQQRGERQTLTGPSRPAVHRAGRGVVPWLAVGAAAAALLLVALAKCGSQPALPVATATVSRLVASHSEVAEVTSTPIGLMPSPTSAPTPEPTNIPPPSPVPILAPAPVLDFLPDHASVSGDVVELRWTWQRPLGQNEHFDVRVWRKGEDAHGIAWHDMTSYQVRGLASGNYHWSILVVRDTGRKKPDASPDWEQVSEESEVRSFSYSAPPKPTNPARPTLTPLAEY